MNKKIENNLISGFDQLAPDCFTEISKAEPQRAGSEAELFSELRGKNEYNKVNTGGHFGWKKVSIAILTLAAAVLITVFSAGALRDSQVVGRVIIDVNPSISIAFNKDNEVEKISAENNDGKGIVNAISSEINRSTTTDEAVKILMSKLRENGYFKKEEADMLVSYSYKHEDENADVEKSVKKAVNEYAASKKLKTECVYQMFEDDEDLNTEAKSNSISAGKYYFLKKIKDKYKINIDSLMDKPVRVIYKSLNERGIKLEKDGSFEVVKTTENGKISSSKGYAVNNKSGNVSKSGTASKSGNSNNSNRLSSSGKPAALSKTGSSTESGNTGTNSSNFGNTNDSDTADTVEIVNATCTSRGIIRITFADRVYYSSESSVSVLDESGNSLEAAIINKGRSKLMIDVNEMKKATAYSITILGVKSSEDGNEQVVKTTVVSRGKTSAKSAADMDHEIGNENSVNQ